MNVIDEVKNAIEEAGKTKEDILWANVGYVTYDEEAINDEYAKSNLSLYKRTKKLYKRPDEHSEYDNQKCCGVVMFSDGSWITSDNTTGYKWVLNNKKID